MKQNLVELVLVFASFYLPGLLWPDPSLQREPTRLAAYMLQFMTAALPQVLLFIYILWLRRPAGWKELGITRPKVADLPYSLLITLGVFLILQLFSFLLLLLPGEARRFFQAGFRWRMSDPKLIALALPFSVLIGYREELFFRSYLLTRFAQFGLHPAVSVLISSLLFACGHIYQGPAGLAVGLLLGVYFAVVFIKMRNLHRLAWAHAFYNAAILVITMFSGYSLPLPPGLSTLFLVVQ